MVNDQRNMDGQRLKRVNLLLTRDESAWLDEVAHLARARHGATEISRSEIVRAALFVLRGIKTLAPALAQRYLPQWAGLDDGQAAAWWVLFLRRPKSR